MAIYSGSTFYKALRNLKSPGKAIGWGIMASITKRAYLIVDAESEVVTLRAEGRSREDLLAGIHKAMSRRVAIMGKSVGFKKDVVFTGGVAKNMGIKKAMDDEIGLQILIPEEPQIMGALGAAILAGTELKR